MEREERSHYSVGPSANNQKHAQMEPWLAWRLCHRPGPERAKICTVMQKEKENKTKMKTQMAPTQTLTHSIWHMTLMLTETATVGTLDDQRCSQFSAQKEDLA